MPGGPANSSSDPCGAAHYHGLISGDLRSRVAESEAFAGTELLVALARGSRLADTERSAVVVDDHSGERLPSLGKADCTGSKGT